MSVLALRNVSYRYPGEARWALRDFSLDVQPGEFCVVAGLSAAGKSTLLRAACGLVPHFHGGYFAGRVTVGGLDTRSHGPAQIAAVAGTCFQDPETQVISSSVRAELAVTLENLGEPPAAVARGVEETALALGIAHLLERPTQELSGGELQRVALGAALAPRPALVLLDEPTSQLDPVAGDELIWLLRRLNQEWDTAIVLIEHRLERCLAAADRVLVLEHGRLACDRDPGGFLRWAGQHACALQTPGASLLDQLGLPMPASVRQARATLRALEMLPQDTGGSAPTPPVQAPSAPGAGRLVGRLRRGGGATAPAVRMRGVWHELREGPAVLRGVDCELMAGETIALMGRNGAGKSTLLRHLGGLLSPTRGRVDLSGRVALLLQHPGDYFLHERVGDEAPPSALAAAGLSGLEERNPRDLSGGQRQRLALAIVAGHGDRPVVLALDEPTRGLDRAAKETLARWLRARATEGIAVLVATHDVEFAAAFAERVLLMAEGRMIADGPTSTVLCGGWYFSTETARILGGAGGALRPEQGAALLRDLREPGGARSSLPASRPGSLPIHSPSKEVLL